MWGVLVIAELNPDTHVGSWASAIMTFADRSDEVLFGPTRTFEALKASYASKSMADWEQKAPKGSMLACCTDNFFVSLLKSLDRGGFGGCFLFCFLHVFHSFTYACS